MLALNFYSADSSTLSAFTELKSIRALLWGRLWLKGMSWLVWSCIQTTFPILAIRLFHFFIIHVFAGETHSFKNLSFAFTTGLFGTTCLAFGLSRLWTWVLAASFRYQWPQITRTRIVLKMSEILQELSKWDTDVKWTPTLGKMSPIDLLDAQLPQMFGL